MIDQELKPWLLEINNNPSFNIEHEIGTGSQTNKEISPVDNYVKTIALEDALFLVKKKKK